MPDICHRASIEQRGIVGKNVRARDHQQGIARLRFDIGLEVGWHPALDKPGGQQLADHGRRIGNERHVGLHIARLNFANDGLHLRGGLGLGANRLDAILGAEPLGDVDNLAGAVEHGQRRLRTGGLDQGIEVKILRDRA